MREENENEIRHDHVSAGDAAFMRASLCGIDRGHLFDIVMFAHSAAVQLVADGCDEDGQTSWLRQEPDVLLQLVPHEGEMHVTILAARGLAGQEPPTFALTRSGYVRSDSPGLGLRQVETDRAGELKHAPGRAANPSRHGDLRIHWSADVASAERDEHEQAIGYALLQLREQGAAIHVHGAWLSENVQILLGARDGSSTPRSVYTLAVWGSKAMPLVTVEAQLDWTPGPVELSTAESATVHRAWTPADPGLYAPARVSAFGEQVGAQLAGHGIETVAQLVALSPAMAGSLEGVGAFAIRRLQQELADCGVVWNDPHRH